MSRCCPTKAHCKLRVSFCLAGWFDIYLRWNGLPTLILCHRAAHLNLSNNLALPIQTTIAGIGRYARLILDQCQGNKRRACQILDISYHTLQTYLEYGHDPIVSRTPTSSPSAPEMAMGMLCEKTG